MDLKPIIPFEPVSSEKIPSGKEWISQIKWDGVRILTYYDGNEIQLFNRKLRERTLHFPEITAITDYFKGKSVIFDGEVIALDEKGNPSFHQVMRRDGLRKMNRIPLVKHEVPIFYMIFDILYYNGSWIHDRPLKERLSILHDCVRPHAHVQLVPSQEDTVALWKVAKEHHLEGIVCKNLNSSYTIDGKDASWQKVKNYQDTIAVIAGVTYRAEVVNSVLLGLYDHVGHLWYIGHCGTGKMSRKDWQELTNQVEAMKLADKPFYNEPERIKDAIWVRPELTVKVQYIEWPEGKTLRQPSIQAFTEIPAKDCMLPDDLQAAIKQPKAKQATSLSEEENISHPDKPLWKEPAINKQQYIEYLHGIFPYISPFLHNRLLTVIRYPHGMFGDPFYQKNCPDYAPGFVQTKESEGINYIVCNNLETFLWLGNQLAFEFHIPFQTIEGNGSPSEIVFDLDPPSKDAFSLAIKAANMIKEVLDSLHLISFVKTSGNKGIQIYIPLPDNQYSFDDTRLFTAFMAEYLIVKDPDSFTVERMKKKRGGRLYVDYVQHAEGKTIIAPFSPRGNPKATIAAPLYWEEVKKGLTMESFQIPTILERMDRVGNPFAGFFEAKQKQNFDPVLQFLKTK
ncbi:DNA ligase D [Bacillus tuaregi]|uniref:DNA ligase D n=1 Tax=Bacillus tuaregi TaxID=1816695 RepID=UPI0008F952E0|nr:DNA ligase D [Bacillus tuaregi]